MISASMPGESDRSAAASAPPVPASAAPGTRTEAWMVGTWTPSAPGISRSIRAARLSRLQRVRPIRSHSPTATATPTPQRKRRWRG